MGTGNEEWNRDWERGLKYVELHETGNEDVEWRMGMGIGICEVETGNEDVE